MHQKWLFKDNADYPDYSLVSNHMALFCVEQRCSSTRYDFVKKQKSDLAKVASVHTEHELPPGRVCKLIQ